MKNQIHPAMLPYLSEHWAIETMAGQKLTARLLSVPSNADLSAYYYDSDSGEESPAPAGKKVKKPYQIAGGAAVLPLVGLLQKRDDWFTRWYPEDATATDRFSANVQSAANDPDVTSIILYVDSPGGLVDGTSDAAEAVYSVRQAGKKPVIAVVSGLCCSAAYWIASQASEIWAGQTDWVGSVGTRLRLMDSSAYFAELGFKPIEVVTGTFKAAGAAGIPIGEDDQAYFQNLVERSQVAFSAGIARGRKMPVDDVRKIASEARIYVGKDAQDAGLIDGIATLPEVLRRLSKSAGSGTSASAVGAHSALRLTAATSGKEGAALNIKEQLSAILASWNGENDEQPPAPAAAPVAATPTAEQAAQTAEITRLKAFEQKVVGEKREAAKAAAVIAYGAGSPQLATAEKAIDSTHDADALSCMAEAYAAMTPPALTAGNGQRRTEKTALPVSTEESQDAAAGGIDTTNIYATRAQAMGQATGRN